MSVLMACMAAHALAAQLIPSPWWVPDFTLIGLVMSVGRSPGRWLALSAMAALFMLPWAVRFPWQVGVSYAGFGWLIRAVSDHWDTTDERVQVCLAAVGAFILRAGGVWLEECWSLPVVGLLGWHVALTAAVLPWVRRWVRSDRTRWRAK